MLRNVNVIDGTGAPAQPNTTVVIDSDRIRSIATEQTDTQAPNAKGFSQSRPHFIAATANFATPAGEGLSFLTPSFERGDEATLW